jgi:N-acetylglutamate synthase-like GNAT family acetyltransferase
MKNLRKFITTTIRELLNENVTSQTDDIYIKYETFDKKGYADIEKTSSNVWHISLIESRRKGAGTELMNRIISDAKKLGIRKITLTTTEQSGWGFFDKFGFVEVGDNNDPFDISMVLKL